MEGESSKLGLELVELGDGGGGGGGDGGPGGVLYVQDGLMQVDVVSSLHFFMCHRTLTLTQILMQGPSGEQYVTIIQDGQTYAIPASDYAAMMAQQGLEVVEPQDNEARVGGDQPERTVLPAVTTQATPSSHLTESLTLPTTPMPPTIPHLTPCPPPTLAQVSNQVVNSPTIKTEPRTVKVGQTQVGKTPIPGTKGQSNASVGTDELRGGVGTPTKLTAESGKGVGGVGVGGGGGGGGVVGGGGGGGGGVRWMSATTPAAGIRNSVKQEPRQRQIYPTMQQVLKLMQIWRLRTHS